MASSTNLIINYLFIATVPSGGGTKQKLDYMSASFNSPKFRLKNYVRSTQSLIITEEYKYSPDLISSDYYGTPDLWWVICRFNGIGNPLSETNGIIPGRRILVPSLVDVKRWLQACKSTAQVSNTEFITV